MADRVREVDYTYLMAPNRAGQGARILAELGKAGVNLVACSAFPGKRGTSQLDLVPEDMAALRRVARRQGWRLSAIKKGFLVEGSDKIGAVHRHLRKLAEAKINVTAFDAACAGKGRYAMLLWVKPKDHGRAAKTLGSR